MNARTALAYFENLPPLHAEANDMHEALHRNSLTTEQKDAMITTKSVHYNTALKTPQCEEEDMAW